jgi:hypothetical protein
MAAMVIVIKDSSANSSGIFPNLCHTFRNLAAHYTGRRPRHSPGLTFTVSPCQSHVIPSCSMQWDPFPGSGTNLTVFCVVIRSIRDPIP